MSTTMSAPVVMTADEVAAYTRLDRRTIYKAVREGSLRCAKAGRALRFHREAVDAWLKGQSEVPDDERSA